MIEFAAARSGQTVIRKNGRLLGSSFDPLKEARTWAEKAAPSIEPGMSGFILGAGSGYHVSALAELRPACALIVIDSDAELLREAARLGEWPSQVHGVIADFSSLLADGSNPLEAMSWLKQPAVADGLGGRFAVLKHGPSCLMDPGFFNGIEAAVLARDKVSWLRQLKLRPDLCALLNPDAIQMLGDAPVSIKTLQSLFKDEAEWTRERRIWKVLEELVL